MQQTIKTRPKKQKQIYKYIIRKNACGERVGINYKEKCCVSIDSKLCPN